jgi:hypothetical protein
MSSCSTCRWWKRVVFRFTDPKLPADEQPFGRCHRYAPRPAKDDTVHWPKTQEDDLCGEWSETNEAAAKRLGAVIEEIGNMNLNRTFGPIQETPDE